MVKLRTIITNQLNVINQLTNNKYKSDYETAERYQFDTSEGSSA